MSEPFLVVRDLEVWRGRRRALRVPALEVARGEVVAVIGPNGAGKSTLLQAIALLEPGAHGTLSLGGEPMAADPLRARRRLAMVFQEPLLLSGSVRYNVTLGLRLRGQRGAKVEAQAERWLERFGVAALAHRPAHALSGGEAQRVSLARAFALEPELLLLDEPFAALDPPTRLALRADLAQVLAETRTTCLLVTHDRDEALALGHRVAVLLDGAVVQVGAPEEVFGAPATAAVAAFVGVETLLQGRVRGISEGVVEVEVGPHTLAVAPPAYGAPPPVRPGAAVWVGLRPEDITLLDPASPGSSSARNRLLGRVQRCLPLGVLVRVEIDCGVPLVAHVTRASARALDLAPGRPIAASFKATAAHLLPR